jgi:hypothetical protein
VISDKCDERDGEVSDKYNERDEGVSDKYIRGKKSLRMRVMRRTGRLD